jgi:hypothetical protein
MNTDMHWRKIDSIYWPDTQAEQGRFLSVGSYCDDLRFSATHHGDHDEFWILAMKDGKEIARYNPRFLESIIWAKEL